MPPEHTAPGSAEGWLRFAWSDLALASIPRPEGVLPEYLCYHAQQAAEKALKALLLSIGREVPRTHNIRTLLDLLAERLTVPATAIEAAILTDYAVELRYPGNTEPVDEEELRQAVRLAEGVVRWSAALILGQAGR